MSFILLYGDYGTDFELVANYFHESLSYTAIKLYELKPEDFSEGKLNQSALDQLDASFKLIKTHTKKWLGKKIFYPVYLNSQIDLIKTRAYIHLIRIEEPYLKGFHAAQKENESLTVDDFIQTRELIKYGTDINSFQKFTRHLINCNNADTIKSSMNEDIFLKRMISHQFRPSMDEYFMSIAFLARL